MFYTSHSSLHSVLSISRSNKYLTLKYLDDDCLNLRPLHLFLTEKKKLRNILREEQKGAFCSGLLNFTLLFLTQLSLTFFLFFLYILKKKVHLCHFFPELYILRQFKIHLIQNNIFYQCLFSEVTPTGPCLYTCFLRTKQRDQV